MQGTVTVHVNMAVLAVILVDCHDNGRGAVTAGTLGRTGADDLCMILIYMGTVKVSAISGVAIQAVALLTNDM